MVNTENATKKSPVIAPIPINKVENHAILGVTDESNDCLIISRLIGPRGAAKVTPKVATTSHTPKMSINSNLWPLLRLFPSKMQFFLLLFSLLITQPSCYLVHHFKFNIFCFGISNEFF